VAGHTPKRKKRKRFKILAVANASLFSVTLLNESISSSNVTQNETQVTPKNRIEEIHPTEMKQDMHVVKAQPCGDNLSGSHYQ